MAYVHHEPCPACGSRDNLARYADGSAWCFGCEHYEPPDGRRNIHTTVKKDKAVAGPPADCGVDFSPTALEWLGKYDIKYEEAIKRKIRWSNHWQQLVFLMDMGIWQARNFSPTAKTKYFTQGNVNDHLPIYHPVFDCAANGSTLNGDVLGVGRQHSPKTLILVEDCISAIKIARQTDAMPLLGSSISKEKLARINKFYSGVIFWLDADKYNQAKGLSTTAKFLGLDSRAIYTARDPKEYDDKTIEYLIADKGT